MYRQKVSGTVLDQAVTLELVASSMNEAVNRFMSEVRITKIVEAKKPAENGLKNYDVAFTVGGQVHATKLVSNDVFSILNMGTSGRITVTGVEELGAVEVSTG